MNSFYAIMLAGIISIMMYIFFVFFAKNKKNQEYIKQKKFPNILLWPNWVCSERVAIGLVGLYFYFFTDFYFLGILLYTLSAVLDGVDGLIARYCDMVTKFGEEFDPLCDKLTYLPAMFNFAYEGLLNMTLVIILIVFEILGQFLIRPILKILGISVAANNFGKIKAVICFLLIIYCAIIRDGIGLYIPNFTQQILIICIILSFASSAFKLIPNKLYADILSSLNFFCGIIGIVFVLNEHYIFTAIAIITGQVFDLFDGRMAEKHGGTKFGPWLDDIADFVSFGICPAVMILVKSEWKILSFFIALFYLSSIAYRLWRFLKKDKKDKTLLPGIFKGLPSPAGAVLTLGSCLLINNYYLLNIIIVITSLLLISKIHFIHLGRNVLKKSPKIISIIFGSITFVMIAYVTKVNDQKLLGELMLLSVTFYIFYCLFAFIFSKKAIT